MGSSRVRYGQPHTCLASDESFTNSHAVHSHDPHGKIIPTIIVEIAYSENYESIQDTALRYLHNDNARMVISIKVLATRHRVNQLYCIVHVRDENTVEAIIRNTGVDPDNFIGIGRHGFDAGQNYPELLNDEETFSVIVPNQVIWWNVPEERRFAIDQLRLRLSLIVQRLQICNYI